MKGRTTWWWIRQVGLIILGAFYLYFGIRMLIGAYTLDNPLTFMITFFASNLIILISATLIFGFVYRIVVALRSRGPEIEIETNKVKSKDDKDTEQ